jgi:starch synthase
MNVLLVSAEVDPFAKVGGLADVVGSLPKALRGLNIDARVLMPYYQFIDGQRFGIEPSFSFKLARATGTTDVSVFSTTHDGVPVYFLRGWPYFGEERAVYSDWEHDVPRFIFFCQAARAAAEAMLENGGWFPDVFHVNDWHTGLIPFLVEQKRHADPRWQGVGTIVGIHNMAYQGEDVGGWLWELGLAGRDHPQLVSRGLTDNMLAMAIAYSDIVTTVSPRYAIEIQYPYMSYGLDGLIRSRIDDLYGILNGIDYDVWNPETDRHIVSNYNADNFQERRPPNKRQLQDDSNLALRHDVPVIGLVSRLVWQKGIDLAIPALRRLLSGYDVQFIALGSGDPEYNNLLFRLGADFHWKARANIGYNAAVAQQIYAGCDLFLMPSHYEPCGIGQMNAMRYGALPIVRETGGLADSVENYDNGDGERGTGFMFQWEEADALYQTLLWAIRTFHERPAVWQRMQERAMRTDFSWQRSALEYEKLYRKAVERHRSTRDVLSW